MAGEGRVKLRARSKHDNNVMTLGFIGIPFVSGWAEGPLRDDVKISWFIFKNLSNEVLGHEVSRFGSREFDFRSPAKRAGLRKSRERSISLSGPWR